MWKIVEEFVFWYPAVMAMMWVLGALVFYWSNERNKDGIIPENLPFVSILMPAHNESSILQQVVEQMVNLDYPDYEVILINDGSTDNSSEVMKELSEKYDRVRVVDLDKNCGKANALYLGLIASKGEILVGVDADSYLDKKALRYMVSHFVNRHNGERVGAVTGNPRVRNRGSLLGKIQLCEYASIISLIKRTQRVLGKVMTVSGVCVAYRKRALMDCGFWDRDMMTEDIAVTWKLEKNFWDVRYEPRALCWMLVPETVKGLWRQRKRWSEGGLEVVFRHWDIFKSWRRRRMTPIYLEQVASFVWSVCWLVLTTILIVAEIRGKHVFTEYLWKSQFLSFVCLLQFAVAVWLESHYDRNLIKNTWSVIWYPILYWYINVFITLGSLLKAILPNKKLATWKSPDRGLTQTEREQKEQESGEKRAEENVHRVGHMDFLIKNHTAEGPHNVSNAEPAGTSENDPHIEYENKQKLWKRILGSLFTLLMWTYMILFFAFMAVGIIRDLLGKPVRSFFIYNTDTVRQTEHFFFVLFIAVLIEILLLIFWKEYNRRRFGGLRRRKFQPDITDEEIDRYFELDPLVSQQMHHGKYIEVLHNPIPTGVGQGRKAYKEHKKKMAEERRRKTN
ncbi:MAG: poly-beta-1,6 N-acetyl-D-glucosamine synthase [Lachnospiraceae bacterium]|nr:poly-beta-1,6 N-acetyl-D-glucosamine synthase [Lachnospiraceae bacterium]